MRASLGRSGLTIVELLVAGFILVMLLGMVGTYLAQQSQVNRATHAATEVQDKVRLVSQLVTTDLRLGGGKTYVDSNGAVITTSPPISSCPSDGTADTCLAAADDGVKDSFSTVYLNTLRSTAEACREVGYRFAGNTLQRADSACGASVDLLDPVADASAYSDLATNILAVDIVYKCSDGVELSSFPNALCPLKAGYLRSAVVTVVGRSNEQVRRPSEQFTTFSGATVTCPQDYRCFSAQQEVLTPNLKDR